MVDLNELDKTIADTKEQIAKAYSILTELTVKLAQLQVQKDLAFIRGEFKKL